MDCVSVGTTVYCGLQLRHQSYEPLYVYVAFDNCNILPVKVSGLSSQDLTCNYVTNIGYVDKSLQSLHIKVPHTRNIVECILFIIISFSCFVSLVYEKFYYITVSCLMLDTTKLYKFVCALSIYTSSSVQCLHCVWITRIIWQRLQLTRRAVERFDKLSNRNVAWSDRVTVAIVVQPRNENFLTEVHDNYKVIGSVYETFSTVTQLHAMYFCVYLLAEITVYSFQIFCTTTDANRRDGTLFAIITSFGYV